MARIPIVWAMAVGAAAVTVALIPFPALKRLARSRDVERERSEGWVERAAAAAESGMWEWHVAPDRFSLTETGRALLGFPPGAPRRLADLLERIHPADRAVLRHGIERALQESAQLGVEFRIAPGDGGERWISARGRAGPGERGNMLVCGDFRDVTERRRMENRVLSEQHHAQREAAQRRTELAHLSRVTLLGELSGSIAHELNQPLAAILSNAQAAQRFLARGPDHIGEVREILEDIVKDDRRAGEVIKRLRVLLKKDKVRYSSLPINDLIVEVLHLMRSDLLNRNVSVRTELTSGLPMIQGDNIQLQQVLLNLMLNGCDAMDDVVPARRELLVRTAQAPDGMIETSVLDHGPGISQDRLERVFDPFITTKSNGLGLGLAVCRTIVESHGGRIRASNAVLGGAEFIFALPAYRHDA